MLWSDLTGSGRLTFPVASGDQVGLVVPTCGRPVVQPAGEGFLLSDQDGNTVKKNKETIYFQPQAKMLNS